MQTIRSRFGALIATAMIGLLPGCGAAPAPVLLLSLNGVHMMGAELKVTLIKDGKPATVTLYRNGSNVFVAQFGSPPAMMPAPSSVKVAFDLPLGTSGALSIQAASFGSSMMGPGPLMKQAEGCTTTTIRDGELNEVSLTMVQPPAPSSCQ
ncbi:MAG: hypothetical protein JNM83_18090 [Myxococcales bacterium]|jgi:hypothetical protein|nr:hypothetical protein [Myxococcales bacterium]